MSHDQQRANLQQLFSRRSFLRVAGLSAAAVGVAACGSSETPAAGSSTSAAATTSAAVSSSAASSVAPGTYGSIAVQLSWIKNIEFSGEYFAETKGYYTAAGFEKVELVSGPVDSADALVFAGSIDVGISAPDATARLISEQGAPLKVIGATFQKNPFCILSLEDATPIKTPADLKGKKIGVQTGTNQAIFAGFLSANGIDAADVTQVAVGFEPTPLTAGEVDGFMSFITNEPFLVKAQGHTPVTLSFADNGLPLASESFTVTQEAIDTKRDLLKAYLKAEIQGWNDAVADPAESARLAVEVFGKDLGLDIPGQTEQAEAQAKLIATAETATNGLFTISDELMTGMAAAFIAIGITDVTPQDVFDLTLLAEVYAENPDLIVG